LFDFWKGVYFLSAQLHHINFIASVFQITVVFQVAITEVASSSVTSPRSNNQAGTLLEENVFILYISASILA